MTSSASPTIIHEQILWLQNQKKYLDFYCDTPWARWLVEVLPETFVPRDGKFVPFAQAHREFWEWVWLIEPNTPVEALLPVWSRDFGKALALDTPIVTPSGWTTMGTVSSGDVVYAHDGTPTTVLVTSPIEVRDCYRVSFSDGTSIVASDDHLWTVLGLPARRQMVGPVGVDWPSWRCEGSASERDCEIEGCDRPARLGNRMCSAHTERHRKYGAPHHGGPLGKRRSYAKKLYGPETLTTRHLAGTELRVANEYQWAIPLSMALSCPETILPVRPWLLGAWLGDGDSSGARITVGKQDAVDTIRLLRESWGAVSPKLQPDGSTRVALHGLSFYLRNLGLMRNKHIPYAYMRASVAQRLELLQGLLDTDGSANRAAASAEFTTIRRNLADQVVELARTLGLEPTICTGIASLNGMDCGPKYRVHISSRGCQLFRLSRKAAIQDSRTDTYRLAPGLRYISAIEPVSPTAVRCITVGHPDSLYLAGEGMIPTHNSTNAEAAIVYLAGERKRFYALYSCSTQDRADEHLGNVSALLERPNVQARYPDLCDKAMTQFGVAKGWRVNLLRTKSGFSAASVGLDKAVRGTKLEDQRPDFLVLDDVDDDSDTARAVAKKETVITQALLPAGDRGNLAVVFPQNLVTDHSVMARLVDGKSDFLRDRRLSGPHPAITDLAYDEHVDGDGKRLWRITAGTPTWDGMDLGACESVINKIGIRAFLLEYQHQRGAKTGALWNREIIEQCRADRPAHMVRISVNVDPEASGGATGSKTGITVTARDERNHGYLLADHSDHYRGTTRGLNGDMEDAGWGQKVVDLVEEWNADCVVAEINQGGDMVRSIVHLINPNIDVREIHAKRGKALRAAPVAQLYARGLAHHVGTFKEAEDQMCEVYDPFHPTITWDNLDSLVYGFHYLLIGQHDSLRALDPNKHRVPRPQPARRPTPIYS